MTPEEKAEQLYKTNKDQRNVEFRVFELHRDRREVFIEGANWMAEEKYKEIAALKAHVKKAFSDGMDNAWKDIDQQLLPEEYIKSISEPINPPQ